MSEDGSSDYRAEGKKRTLYITAALFAAVVIVVGSFLFGFLVNRKKIPPYDFVVSTYYALLQHDFFLGIRQSLADEQPPDGGWHLRRGEPGDLTAQQEEELRKLTSLGYASGGREQNGQTGITFLDVDSAYEGLNLYNSGHGPEATLMEMDGSVIHRWKMPFERAFPGVPIHPNDDRPDFWRKVYLYPNGDLLAIFEGLGIVKIDKDSNLIWSNHNRSHHDLAVQENGEIFVLTRTPRMIPKVDELHPVLEDFISVLGPDGRERRRYSIVEAVMRSDYSSLMEYVTVQGDIFHTNTLEILDGRHRALSPAFESGNALISMPNINSIAIVNLEHNEVVWALGGLFAFQHDPTFLEDGNLLVFDNLSQQSFSRVLELNPLTQEITWMYRGSEKHPFFSELIGTSQRLPNGNTLITETVEGRAFEVTRDGLIVWEFKSPHSAGSDGELVAVLPEMKRLDAETTLGWLSR